MYPDPMNQTTADNDSRIPPPLSEDTAEGTLIISAGYGNRAYPLPGVRAEIYVPAEEDTPDDKRELLYAVRQTDDPAAQQALLRRIADLQPMLYQCRQLRDLTAHYYERSFHRNENYTL